MVVLPDGGKLLVWSGSGIYGQRYDAMGSEVGQAFQINTTTLSRQWEPEATLLANGRVLVTWEVYDHVQRGQIIDPDGTSIGDEFTFGDARYSADNPVTVTSTSDGGFILSWVAPDSSGHGVFVQRYGADGLALGDPFLANTAQGSSQRDPSIVELADGGFVVAWASPGGVWGGDGSYGIFGQIYDANGAPVGMEFHINTEVIGFQKDPELVAMADGGFMALWEHNETEFRFQHYASDGTVIGTEGTLDLGTQTTNMFGAEGGKVILLEGGGIAVAWWTLVDGESNLAVQSFALDGSALTDATLILAEGSSTFDLDQYPNGSIVLTWDENGSIYEQSIDAPPPPPAEGSTVELLPTSLYVQDPSVVVLPDGGKLLVWSGSGIYGQRYDAMGSEVGQAFQINTTTLSRQWEPEATLLANGRVLVTWEVYDHVQRGQIIDPDGTSIGDEFTFGDARYSADNPVTVTSTSDGGFILSWVAPDSSGHGVFVQRYGADGLALGDPFLANTAQGSSQRDPSIVELADGGFVVAWASPGGVWGGDGSYGIFGQIYDANGAPVGMEFHINTEVIGFQKDPELVAMADGGFMALWEHNETEFRFQHYASDGTVIGTEGTLDLGTQTTNMFGAEGGKVILLEGGGIAVAWRTLVDGESNLAVQSFALDGSALTDATLILAEGSSTFDLDQYPNGSIVLTWDENGSIYEQSIDAPPPPPAEGSTVELLPTSLYVQDPSVVVLPDGGKLLVWSGSGIYGQRYDAMGSEVGQAFQINTTTLSRQWEPEATLLANGRVLVTWEVYDHVQRGQIIDPDGTSIGDEFTFGDARYSRDNPVTVTSTSDGGFILSWVAPDSSGHGVFVQRYGADGLALGDPFLANTAQGSSQRDPSIVELADGGFVVAWASPGGVWGGDGSYGIFGQIYDANGAPVGMEFHINTEVIGFQKDPELVAMADGGFMALWEHNETEFRFQHYASDGTVIGTEGTLDLGTQTTNMFGAEGGKVILLEGGGIAVAWWTLVDGESNLAVQSFALDGSALTDATLILAEGSSTFDLDQYPNGSIVLTWDENGSIYEQSIDAPPPPPAEGSTVELLPTSLYVQDPSVVVLPDGGKLLVWSGSGIYGQRYDAMGSEVGQAFQINTTTLSRQWEPEATLLANGRVLVTWEVNDHVQRGQIIDPDGTSIGDEFTFGDARYSADNPVTVTSTSDGGFILSWVAPDSSGHGVFVQRYGADGLALGDPFLANTAQGSSQRDPSIVELADGGFVVAWASPGGVWGGDGSYGIFGQIYDANGAPVGMEFHINTEVIGSQKDPELVAMADGGFMALWEHNETEFRFQHYASDGTVIGTEGTLDLGTQTTNMFGAEGGKVILLEGGGIAVAWRTLVDGESNLAVQSFALDGSALTDATLILAEGSSTFDLDQYPNGSIVLTWDENGSIYEQSIDAPPPPPAEGSTVELLPTSLYVQDPSVVVLPDGGKLLVWSGSGIYGQRYDAMGSEVGQAFQINTTTLSRQWEPEATLLANGRVLVTWEVYDHVQRGQIIDPDGTSIGDEFTFGDARYSRDNPVTVTSTSDGGFILSWVAPDSSGHGVFVQRYGADGLALGDPFLANTAQGSSQRDPSIVELADGGFVVAWASPGGVWGGDGSYGIFGQIYDANGAPVGMEFHINTEVIGSQKDPELVAMADGGFMALWEHNETEFRFQHYASDGTVIGTEGTLDLGTQTTNMFGAEGGKVILLEGGGIAVAWWTLVDGESNLAVQSFALDGSALTDATLILAEGSSTFDLDQYPNGSIVLTWDENGSIYEQSIDAPPPPPAEGSTVELPNTTSGSFMRDSASVVVQADDFVFAGTDDNVSHGVSEEDTSIVELETERLRYEYDPNIFVASSPIEGTDYRGVLADDLFYFS
ncbi:hypothetical protein [Phaeobacter porticola]|uniref:hypothetical protein n=1 Tax=Phaeobacter porticola TaxID=1844006 RepID=UPI0012FF7912|nr:hypothetical protein [Phaeobacter porticola]